MVKKTFGLIVSFLLLAAPIYAADAGKPTIAKICTNCHKAEPNALWGYFENVAFKSKTIQMKIDDTVRLVKFDEDEIKVINKDGKTGDGELLKGHKVAEGHEIKIVYTESNGEKTAVSLTEKPPVKIPDSILVKTEDVQKLVSKGKKGGYYLFDSRPLPRFQEGYIPTAVNLPFPEFDKLAPSLLPLDKNSLIIFYSTGQVSSMSPASANKAKALGYTNIKIYKDGITGWLEKNYGVISSKFLKEAWIDKDIPYVLLDARDAKKASKEFIKGGVSFPAKSAGKLAKKLDITKNAPIIVYDARNGKDAAKTASIIVKAGFKNVLVLEGGLEAWKSSKYDVVSGKLAAKAVYVPKPRQGEIALDEFRKYAEKLPENVMIIDVRNTDEGNTGMLPTAKLIPAEELKARVAEIPKDKMIITHCATGVRAEMAYHELKELGFTNVKFLNAKVEFSKEKKGEYKIFKD